MPASYQSYCGQWCSNCNVDCQNLNTCQSCNSCESCNSSCNAGAGACNTIQAFCSIGGQSVGGFSFGSCVSSDQFIDIDSSWNGLLSYINAAYAKGSSSLSNGAQSGSGVSGSGNAGSSGLPNIDTSFKNTDSQKKGFITANMFNQIAAALGGLGSSGPNTSVKSNDIIYGSYFEQLETYANILQYQTTQCDNCNAGCNVKCNTCLKCNEENCGTCNGSCQSHSPSYSDSLYCCSCDVCDTCQTTCELSCQTGQSCSSCQSCNVVANTCDLTETTSPI